MNHLKRLEKKLAREVSEVRPSAALEAALLAEFDAYFVARGRKGIPRAFLFAAVPIAATLLFALWPHSQTPAKPAVVAKSAEAPMVEPVLQASAPRLAPKHRRAKPTPAGEPEPQFIRIPYSTPLEPYERAEIVRVEMPVSALAAAGVQLSVADTGARAQADLVIGEDGLARAVRLISILNN